MCNWGTKRRAGECGRKKVFEDILGENYRNNRKFKNIHTGTE